MPRGDRTGPDGMGPRTGRAAGFCSGYDRPGFMNGPGMRVGRGLGMNRGMARGFGTSRGRFGGKGFSSGQGYGMGRAANFANAPTPEDEKSYLKEEEGWLSEQLKAVKERLNNLEQEE